MECNNLNEANTFHKVVLKIKENIDKYYLIKWKDIVKPENEILYNEYFEKLIQQEENIKYDIKDYIKFDGIENIHNENLMNYTLKNSNSNINNNDINNIYNECDNSYNVKKIKLKDNYRYEINKQYFDNISEREKFYFLLQIKEMMETSWLLAQKRMEGIQLEEKSDSINLLELINYSKKIADTTCAPPECDNTNDKIMHQEYYPNYHFLNFINIEEIHLSKLFQLQKYSKVCFPPIITLQEEKNNNQLTITITCSTIESIIYYKVNDETNYHLYDHNNKPMIPKRKKVIIYAWSIKEGFIKSRISCLSKSYEVQDDSDEDILTKDKNTIHNDTSNKNDNSNKTSSATSVFKSLGFFLSKKKVKSSESSSHDQSSEEE
ncbi:conserved Plasmodium protein, unknown function [Plasmodium reichenowi]|uniref:Mediator of RNA polymerase II transcription subunit 4 n=1 Tax=Plasmodium reichenowi TaxID=5854 RepID=A0A151L5V7_PLARE|nr:hypothetical protein PRSY57_1464400 [Plasmodium reichenowi]KYN94302.1 hypothetical protein PRSY57_1464400 [Plasmodium reichenowi]SOV83408.1 conserved Plasmodium protein, unknown function [Plasmodium reichenowi]